MESHELHKRKGMVLFSNDFLKSADSDILSEVFTNFFPISIQKEGWQDGTMYFGFCEKFEEIKEFEVVPTYHMILEIHRDVLWFKGFKKLDANRPIIDQIELGENEFSTLNKM